jgi:hypothetical protein
MVVAAKTRNRKEIAGGQLIYREREYLLTRWKMIDNRRLIGP